MSKGTEGTAARIAAAVKGKQRTVNAIADATKMTTGTIRKYLKPLLANGTIKSAGKDSPTGLGRPATLYTA